MIATILGDKGVDALLQSALGAEVDGGIRICGTRGRIEWLARLRKNGQKGGRPRKPKGNQKETIWFSDGKPGANPPAPAPAPAPAQTEKDASPHNPDRALALRLILKIIGNFPGNKLARQSPSEKDATILKWSEHVRRMREIDRRSESDIAAVIDWCQADSFWRKNIWSTDKLRDKWDRLIADMGSKAPRQVKRVAEQPALEFPIGDCEVLR